MKLGLHQSARLEQRLIQSPQMIQAMQILQLPLLDLSERIEQELMENPFLEVAEPEASGASEEGGSAVAEADGGAESMLEMFERIERDHGDGSRARVASAEEGDRKYEAMLNAPEGAMTFAEAVLGQLGPLELSERERTVLEYVVWSLDEQGYLTETPATLAAELTLEVQRTLGVDGEEEGAAAVIDDGPPEAASEEARTPSDEDLVVTEDEVRDALERLRETVHPGLGALDLSECLLLQLPGAGLWNPFMRKLVQSHLGDISANRLPQIAKSTGRDIEDVKAAIELLKRLDPSPGAGFGDTAAEVIHPEVMVELDDEQVTVRLDRERTPSLRLNPLYQTAEFRRMLKEGSKEEREWAKKRLENASWFIDAILQRESTLKRISVALFNRQRAFLERGKEALRPLRMQEIADEVGVHISTVSRGVAGKYAQTPRGIFPLKFFFTGGTTKTSGEEASQITIKERIKKIVAAEAPEKPLSDDAIAKALEDEDGIKIARRTVTKYRKALEIPSSTQRKKY
ncbi:MAG: RNA polymerase factor sigma-54 [Planctomycetota bacterium]|nr:RNA polymerase factor sigma-54 [Planctomycetota bacterium]MEE2940065.1 RNA polymerase factor sigma-54 [Planctomycetota bacterium]